MTELLTRARITGLLSWQAIHDPTRPVITWNVYREHGSFIRDQLKDFLQGYWRDLMQSQPNHIEIVGEKNTIESIVRRVASYYTIPFTLGRGYSSLPPRRALFERFQRSGKELLIILTVSDFDPEGVDIPHSFARSMRDDFGVNTIKAIRVALSVEQVRALDLPPDPMPAKKGGSRYKKFRQRYGDDAYELEAIPPDRLEAILRETIDSVLDLDAFNGELDREKQDAAYLEAYRRSLFLQMGQAPPP